MLFRSGKERVSSVMVSRVDENRKPIPGTEFEIECDTLMISAGLIPENELTEQAGIEISKGTHGAVVTEDLQTSAKGFFACGNVLHVHDLVDFVATEAEEAGVHAAKYIQADTGDAGETIIWEACSSSASTMDSVCIGSRRISPAWSSPENTVIWWRNGRSRIFSILSLSK